MKEGDFVIYFANQKPHIGKYVRTQFNKRIVIIPKGGLHRIIRNKELCVSVNELVAKYGELLKGQTR